MAIAEVKYGKGRFIMLGTPFYLSLKDDTGKWLNDDSRQKLLQELISSLGIKRDTDQALAGRLPPRRPSQRARP